MQTGESVVIVSGNDFYSSPRLSPDRSLIAWLTWNHPNMPWDGTELWLGKLTDNGSVVEKQKIAGGVEQHGLGDGAGLIFGMGLANSLNPVTGAAATENVGQSVSSGTPMSLDEQIEAVKKLKELLDAGILTQEEFEAKKKQVMGI